MADLSPEAKRLLAQLQSVDDPTPAERASGDAAVRRMLESHGMELPLPSAENTSPVLAARSGAAFKLAWLLGAALFAAMGWWGFAAWRSSETTASAPMAESPLPSRGPGSAATEAEAVAEPTPGEVVAETAVQPQPAGHAAHASAARKRHKTTDDSLAAELRFLSSVDAEIRAGAHERALHMLQQHKPSTAILQEERTAMRVLALCGRALDVHAVRERDQFLKAHPSSVLSARVRSACSGVPNP